GSRAVEVVIDDVEPGPAQAAEAEWLDESVVRREGGVEAQVALGPGPQQHGVRIEPRHRELVQRADVRGLEANDAPGPPAQTQIPRPTRAGGTAGAGASEAHHAAAQCDGRSIARRRAGPLHLGLVIPWRGV